ncbi:MAG: cobyric acid synthase [Acidimicrobiales bacterium]
MTGRSGAVLVAGATSGAGKSTVAAALCRSLHRRGLAVAPFKAQNMSNHAAVTEDGGEVGRAQAMQADAARVRLDRRMNPILLKPSSEQRSHLVVLGDERDVTDAAAYGPTTQELKPVVLDALTSLRRDHAWVVAEGAGGAAEINLLERDLVNLPLARAAGMPAILVVDIERGGAFAAAHGTIDLVPPDLRRTVAGVAFNNFRGDPELLSSGIAELERRTGVPVLGVLPSLGPEPLLAVEDSLDVGVGGRGGARSTRPVRVAAVLLPHLANPSDLDPFDIEPDVVVRWVTGPGELADADLVVIPGTRATVADLRWLQVNGFAEAINAAARSATVIGICGGYQMLGRRIEDAIESKAGEVDALGLLDATTRFVCPKIVRTSQGWVGDDAVRGYQIRFGRPEAGGTGWLDLDGASEGTRSTSGWVAGTSLHGIFDADGFRSSLLGEIADARGRSYQPSPIGFAEALEHQHERLADWIDANLDVDEVLDLAATASAPSEVPGW